MTTLGSQPNPGPDPGPPDDDLRARWVDRYGPVVAAQLDASGRYSLIKVGAVQFAYTTYARYARALKDIWGAGLVPEPLPTVSASELLDVAPRLQSVDADLQGIRRSDLERRSRFS